MVVSKNITLFPKWVFRIPKRYWGPYLKRIWLQGRKQMWRIVNRHLRKKPVGSKNQGRFG